MGALSQRTNAGSGDTRSPESTACGEAVGLFADSTDTLPYLQWLSQRFALSTGSISQGMAAIGADAPWTADIGHEYAATASCANTNEVTARNAVSNRHLRVMRQV